MQASGLVNGRGSAACGWSTAAVLAAAPLVLATRPPWAIAAVEAAAVVAALAWAAWVVLRRRRPAVPRVLAGGLAGLLVLGTVSTANPRSRYDPVGRRLVPVGSAVDLLPSAIDRRTSAESMVRYAVLAAVLVVCCDGTATDPTWCRRVLAGVAGGGTAVAVWGVLQRAGAVPPLRLEPWAREGVPFGPFSYHANAGAALNLGLAAALGLAAGPRRGTRRGTGRAAAVAMAAACAAGALVNVSRAAQVLTGATLAVAACLWLTTRGRRGPTGGVRRAGWAWAVAGTAVLAVAVVAGGPARRRWGSVGQELTANSARPILWRIGLGLAGQGGPWGLGPGAFKVVLPMAPGLAPLYPKYIVTWYVPGRPVSMWSNAHQDLLQAAVEWGWVGAGLWVIVIAGGAWRAAGAGRPWAVRGAGVGLAVVGVHAMLDFPLQIFCIQLQVAGLLGVAWGSRTTASGGGGGAAA